jgi:hypothetical protein
MNEENGMSAAPDRKKAVAANVKIQYVLRGFSQGADLRVFTFEVIAAGREKEVFTVSADLSMTRRYGIRIQELPLLCRSVLERGHEDGEDKRAFAYSEEEMRSYASDATARELAAKQRKPPRRPVTENVGAAWRVPPR